MGYRPRRVCVQISICQDLHVKSAAETAAQQSMAEAATELREARGATSDELVDCRTMFDGTWRKRGHSSLQGAVTCISADTGKVLDYEGLNKVCHKCARFSDQESPEYQNFIANHKCPANYNGSAASMEPTGIKRIYQRSIQRAKLRYTEYLGDGDSSSFNFHLSAPVWTKSLHHQVGMYW